MPTALAARLDWLEAKIPDEKRSRRVICVVASVMEEATEFARSLGYDPNNEDDFLIVNRIVGDGYTAPYCAQPRERPMPNALEGKLNKLEAQMPEDDPLNHQCQFAPSPLITSMVPATIGTA